MLQQQFRGHSSVLLHSLLLVVLGCFFGGGGFAQTGDGVSSAQEVGATPTPRPVDIEKLPVEGGRKLYPWEETYRVHKSLVTPVGEKRVKVGPFGGPTMNVIGEEGDYLLIRMAPPEDPSSPYHKAWSFRVGLEASAVAQAEVVKQRYFVADKPLVTPPFTQRLSFRLWSGGLPQGGEWQVSGDVADFNGDGLLDLVLPPPRGGKPTPTIYLNRGDGNWLAWGEQRYPTDVPFDYGSVRVADFDRDGNLDLALACHFKGFFVLYGDGKGSFLRWQQLPTLVSGVTSKVLEVADLNNDGRPDLGSLAEIDLNMTALQRIVKGLVPIWLNFPEGWVVVDGQFPEKLMGDRLAFGDLDGDEQPDLILGSLVQGQDHLMYLNRRSGRQWDIFGLDQVPYNAFVNAVTIGSLDRKGKGRNVALVCFEQVNPLVQEDPTQGCALYRFGDGKEFNYKPEPELLFTEKVPFRRYQAVSIGDVDGDGRQDLAVGNSEGVIRIFLQLSKGKFFENTPPLRVHGKVMSLKCADLDNDKRDELIVMAVPTTPGVGGGVWVFHAESKGSARK